MAKKRRGAKRPAVGATAARDARAAAVVPAPRVPRPALVPRERAARDPAVAIAVTLALAAALAYLPALGGEFINWDDPTYVTANPNIRGLSWRTASWAFTTFHSGNWHPLTWLSLALDHQLWGLRPFGSHLTSLLLHVANTLLVFLFLRGLTGAAWRSAAVAALSGLHPLHVESVAWVAERKDVLSAFFSLLAMAAYARYVRGPTWSRYGVVVLAFALALLAKPMAITLPLALLLVDYWPLGRLSWRAVGEKVPLIGLAAALSAATFAAQTAEGAVGIDPIPLAARVGNALLAYVRYLALTFWPLHLSPWYSHPALDLRSRPGAWRARLRSSWRSRRWRSRRRAAGPGCRSGGSDTSARSCP